MATTINKSLADTYFAPNNHLQSALWYGFDDGLREAAVAEAIRLLSRALGESLTNETVDTDDYYYPDRAAYEQALYMLINSEAIANGEQTAPKFIAPEGSEEPRRRDNALIAKEAKRWLGWGVGATIAFSRG